MKIILRKLSHQKSLGRITGWSIWRSLSRRRRTAVVLSGGLSFEAAAGRSASASGAQLGQLEGVRIHVRRFATRLQAAALRSIFSSAHQTKRKPLETQLTPLSTDLGLMNLFSRHAHAAPLSAALS
jgi:hypothetical protein